MSGFQEETDAFLRQLRAGNGRSDVTVADYRESLSIAAEIFTQMGLSSFFSVRPDDARLLILKLGSSGSGHAAATVRSRVSALRSLYSFAIGKGLIASDPTEGIRLPRIPKRIPHTLTPDEMNSLLDYGDPSDLNPADLRDRAAFELFYSSGLRLSELAGLNLPDIDLRGLSVRVIGKGNKERIVPVTKTAREAIEDYLPLREKILAERGCPEETALFVSRLGRRISTREIEKRLKLLAERQGMDHPVHPHMLRHSFATHMLQSSGNIRAVQELLGHENLSTTQIYTDTDLSYIMRVYDSAHPHARKKPGDDA